MLAGPRVQSDAIAATARVPTPLVSGRHRGRVVGGRTRVCCFAFTCKTTRTILGLALESEPTAQWWNGCLLPRTLDVSMWRSWRKRRGHLLDSASKHAKLPMSDICKENALGQTFGRTKSRKMVVSSNLATIVVLFSHKDVMLWFCFSILASLSHFFHGFYWGFLFYLVFGFLSLLVLLNCRSSSEVNQQVLVIIT